MTKKEAIIQYFSSMDFEMLGLVLDDNRTYQEATKELFIEKLKGVFEEFRSSGDMNLISIKGQCQSISCNYGCCGFAFSGDNSNKRLPLIFEENELDYTDIYFCSKFKTSKGSEVNDDIFLHISKDEKEAYKPSVNYFLRASECKNALLDFEKYNGKVICKEVYSNWYYKHTEHFKSLPGIFSDYNSFFNFSLLWYDIEEIIKTVMYEPKACEALRDFDKIGEKNEKTIINWLLKYEEIGQHIALFLLDKEGVPYLNGPIPLERIEGVYIDQKEFVSFINFSIKYDNRYKLMLDKHNTFENGICPSDISYENFYSLRYQIKNKTL